ncbi:MAG: sugar O-acetyltransferase, partial [Clostridia bacterium]|nr:sugar O-acetyltransferase [Clostridia bacterium]
MSQYDKLHDGSLYLESDPSLFDLQQQCIAKVHEYNAITPCDKEKRAALLSEMFAEIGEGCYIEPPFYANWGGKHVHFGKKIYANFHLTLVDDTHIYIGDYTMIGPNVTIATAGHPVDPDLRRKGLKYNLPVRIGRNCWLGAGAVVLPGVTIGDDTVIGASSVVTKDLPSGMVAVGNPCRVLRPVWERDRMFYYRDLQIDPAEIEVPNKLEKNKKST